MSADNRKLVMKKIDLECPKCGLKHSAIRFDDDPPSAVKAWIICPECCGGDFGTTRYEDAKGAEVSWDAADSKS